MYSKKDFQVMNYLSENLNSYEAVTWLATPHPKLDGKSPFEMMKQKGSVRVHSALVADVKILKSKRKKRSRRK